MPVIDVATILSILVALGTLIWQSRQTAREYRLENFRAYTERYQQILLHLPLAIESPDFDFEKLAPEEQDSTLRWLRAYYDLCSEEHYLYTQGLLEDYVWGLWESGMADVFAKPAFRQAWILLARHKYRYAEDFSRFVDDTRLKSQKLVVDTSSGAPDAASVQPPG